MNLLNVKQSFDYLFHLRVSTFQENKLSNINFLTIWNLVLSRQIYRHASNIIRIVVGNKIVDHADVVGAYRRCSNYVFILNLTPGFNGLGKDNCTTRRETLKFGDLVDRYYRFDDIVS